MIINKIDLCNFGSFEGEVQLDVSILNPDKNVILIGGKNGTGKTTLFTAIKLGLYGHNAFGYESTSTNYYRRIKRLMNKNSLSKKDVNTYILLDFDIEEDRELAKYELLRQWKYEDQKLVESFSVKRNQKKLNKEEIESFENYLMLLMPPQLFDLFFFDGEKISEFFLEGNTSRNLREALLMLCGYDTFSIMCNNFKRLLHQSDNELLNEEERKVSELLKEKDKIENLLKIEKNKYIQFESEIVQLEDKLHKLEEDFRNAGGLLAQEMARYENDILKEEKIREEKNEWLRNFANDFLPFIIVKDLVEKVKRQVVMERDYQKYRNVKEALNNVFLRQLINSEINNSKIRIIDSNGNDYSETFSSILLKNIDSKLRPNFSIDNFIMIHGLSPDEESYVLNLIESIESQNVGMIKEYKQDITKSIDRAHKIRKKLEACERNNETLQNYVRQINKTKEQIGRLMTEKGKIEVYIENLETNLAEQVLKIKKAEEGLKRARKSMSVFEISKVSYNMLQTFIPVLLSKKIDSIKENFMYMFNQLIEKQDFIQDIEIDNDFNVTLYRNSSTSIRMINNIITNIGVEAVATQMGQRYLDKLMEKLNVSKKTDLEKVLNEFDDKNYILELPTKIDINGFSKGEQQIYIMSLFWALIKASSRNIPFVIDTPYARIDRVHREKITTIFFPSLSNQVIILSTDEEVNREYYRLIKPYLAKEFLITYSNQSQNTKIEEKYFFEVAS